jgi:hypothetical protein
MIRSELQHFKSTDSTANELRTEAAPLTTPTIPSSHIDFSVDNEFVEGASSLPMEVDYRPPEIGSQGPPTASNHEGSFILSQISLPDIFLGILQNLWSCSDPIYHGNTSK